MWFMVCRWPQSQEGDWVRPHLSKLAWHGPWPVWKCFTRDRIWRGRSKPGCRIAGSVTTVWLTTEGCVIVSAKCYRWTDIRTDPLQLHRHCSTYYMVTANNRLNGRLWAACLMLSKSLNYLLSLTAVAQWWKCVQELQQKVETASVYTRYRKYRTYPEHRHRNIVNYSLLYLCLQCFDTVGWASGRASGL